VNVFNVVYQLIIAMYDSGCQNWSRLEPGFNVPAHWNTNAANPQDNTCSGP